MISRESFLKLQRGDVVLFGARNTPRLVELGPANFRPAGSFVTFAILKRSWTGRASTTYGYTDIRDKVTLPRSERDKREVRRWTETMLRRKGFDVRAELVREARAIKRSIGLKLFGGRQFVCSRGNRWPVNGSR